MLPDQDKSPMVAAGLRHKTQRPFRALLDDRMREDQIANLPARCPRRKDIDRLASTGQIDDVSVVLPPRLKLLTTREVIRRKKPPGTSICPFVIRMVS
jgi:hypothetical protein